MRNYYRCSDDQWLMMTLTPPDRHWGPLCRALGRAELENDPRFNTDDKRLENAAQLVSIFDEIFATRPRNEWLQIFARYDLFCCEVNRMTDLQDDPQILENGYLIDFEHPTLGKIKIPGYPSHFSKSLVQTTTAAPDLGEHTEEVLTELGGYSAGEIAQMREEGVV
jgi:crotonobetainyl-CoA:carnitine CoA-transferase CaiB-like acyl-CoA transferase